MLRVFDRFVISFGHTAQAGVIRDPHSTGNHTGDYDRRGHGPRFPAYCDRASLS
jgi:hypothetical protein